MHMFVYSCCFRVCICVFNSRFVLLANGIRIGFVTGRRKINQCKASSHRFLQKYTTVPDQNYSYNVPYTLYKQWYSMWYSSMILVISLICASISTSITCIYGSSKLYTLNWSRIAATSLSLSPSRLFYRTSICAFFVFWNVASVSLHWLDMQPQSYNSWKKIVIIR